MAGIQGPFVAAWLFTLLGGLVVLGALGALTSDSEVTPLFGPYRLAWTAWSLEVFGLLVALYALAVGPFRQWKPTVLFFIGFVQAVLIALTNDIFVNKEKLPGSNGSATRANVAGAGLIIVLIGNGILALLSALHDSDPSPIQTRQDPKEVA